jgi:hypothetical protein
MDGGFNKLDGGFNKLGGGGGGGVLFERGHFNNSSLHLCRIRSIHL